MIGHAFEVVFNELGPMRPGNFFDKDAMIYFIDTVGGSQKTFQRERFEPLTITLRTILIAAAAPTVGPAIDTFMSSASRIGLQARSMARQQGRGIGDEPRWCTGAMTAMSARRIVDFPACPSPVCAPAIELMSRSSVAPRAGTVWRLVAASRLDAAVTAATIRSASATASPAEAHRGHAEPVGCDAQRLAGG